MQEHLGRTCLAVQAQDQCGDAGGDRAPGQVERVADRRPERQLVRARADRPVRVSEHPGRRLMGDGLADVDQVEVAIRAEPEPGPGRRRFGRQQPVADAVLEQPRRAEGGERLGVGPEAGAVGAQRAYARRAGRLNRVNGHARPAAAPGQRDRLQWDRLSRPPLRPGQQRRAGHLPGLRVARLHQRDQVVPVRVQKVPLTQPALLAPAGVPWDGRPGFRRAGLVGHAGCAVTGAGRPGPAARTDRVRRSVAQARPAR